MKPDAPDTIRGEFKPIATRTPGIQICEHLPLLAERSQLWALVRSLTHPHPDHSAGHLLMLTGRSQLPLGFDPSKPQAERLAVDRRGRRRRLPAAQQPAAGGRAARDADPSRGPRHSRPVRRRDGRAPQPDVRQLRRASTPSCTAPGPSMAFTTPAAARTRKDLYVQAPNLSLPAGHGRGAVSASGSTCSARSASSRPSWSARPRTSRSTATARRPISLLADRKTQRAFNVADADPKTARSLRPQHVRLVAVDRPATGRGGREPGAGEPGQRRNVGHARQRVPALEGLPCSRRPIGPSRRCSTTWPTRPAGLDADRDGRRNRPHAEDLDAAAVTTPSRAATTGARRPCSSPAAACAAAR